VKEKKARQNLLVNPTTFQGIEIFFSKETASCQKLKLKSMFLTQRGKGSEIKLDHKMRSVDHYARKTAGQPGSVLSNQ